MPDSRHKLSWPGFRHKPRNQDLCGEIRLKQACGTSYLTRRLPSLRPQAFE
jgi:hypothetical protein